MELNKKNILKITGLIAFTVLFYWLVNNWGDFRKCINFVVSLLFPFLIGAAMAFILNCPMKLIEKGILRLKDNKFTAFLKRSRRIISLIITLICIVGILALVIFIVLPELIHTVHGLIEKLQAFFEEVKVFLLKSDFLTPEMVREVQRFEIDWNSLAERGGTWLSEGTGVLVNSTVQVATKIISSVVNVVLGFIFAIYILLQKEKLSEQFKKLLYSFVKEEKADKTMKIVRLVNDTFSNFVTGQCLEACIIGVLFFLGMSLFRFPYALAIGVLIAFTALIPIFGAFIGLVIGIFLIVAVNPMQAVWFVILFFVIQQIEGNLIYPYVVGGQVGLPSIWVLMAVTIGGNMLGVIGMLVFIPMFSVIYQLLRGAVYERLDRKKIKKEKYLNKA